jgi:hypothetical protein
METPKKDQRTSSRQSNISRSSKFVALTDRKNVSSSAGLRVTKKQDKGDTATSSEDEDSSDYNE